MNRRAFLRTGLATAGAVSLPGFGVRGSPSGQGPLRLNANENPLGLSPTAERAIQESLTKANRYPFETASVLRRNLAEFHEIGENNILLGNGSSEALRLAVAALVGENPLVVAAEPTYEAVVGHSSKLGLAVTRVPLDKNFAHDLNSMRSKAEAHDGPVLVYLCNPNNPTGTLSDTATIRDWLQSAAENTYFVIDEAYHHYVEEPAYSSFLPAAARHSNLIVARTFSKVYAMAGLRMGYVVSNDSLIRRLSALTHLNVNQLALVAATASMKDDEFLVKSIASNRKAKQILTETLNGLEIEYIPSQTNFLMMKVKSPLQRYISRMRAEGILVGRPFPPMTTHNRVSLGLPQETEIFAAKLREFRRQGWI